jgi:hypothetical protein
VARPTEPRNSYASGLGTPHSSPAMKNDPYSGSHPVIDRQSRTRKIKGRGVRLHAIEKKCSGLSGRRKTHVHPTETAPTELGVALGRSRAFSSVSAFGKVHLGFRRRCRGGGSPPQRWSPAPRGRPPSARLPRQAPRQAPWRTHQGRTRALRTARRKISNTSKGNKQEREPRMAKAYLWLGHAAPRPRPGLRLSRLQGFRPGFQPRQPGPKIGPAPRRPGRTPTAAVALLRAPRPPPRAPLLPRLSSQYRATGGPLPRHPPEKGA